MHVGANSTSGPSSNSHFQLAVILVFSSLFLLFPSSLSLSPSIPLSISLSSSFSPLFSFFCYSSHICSVKFFSPLSCFFIILPFPSFILSITPSSSYSPFIPLTQVLLLSPYHIPSFLMHYSLTPSYSPPSIPLLHSIFSFPLSLLITPC